MLPIEPATPAELAQDARYQCHEARTMARANADPARTYRCMQCGAVHSARYVAWNGRECTDECGGRLEPIAVMQAVGA